MSVPISIRVKPVRARLVEFPSVVRGHYGILRRMGNGRLTSLYLALCLGRVMFVVDRGAE